MYKFSSVIIYRMETIETGLIVGSTLIFNLALSNSRRRPLLQPQPRPRPRPRLAASADEDAAAFDDDGVSDEEHGEQRTRPRSVRRAADMPSSMFTSGATRVAGAAHPSCQPRRRRKRSMAAPPLKMATTCTAPKWSVTTCFGRTAPPMPTCSGTARTTTTPTPLRWHRRAPRRAPRAMEAPPRARRGVTSEAGEEGRSE